ncbi:sprouty-related, EVH1 domain-containing protein 1 [Aricia agestis]|uniref:sprouty-related, EVH1 domain-containing protein 1 n=1 Tax=Aricia agestis TaxID=91739 RepID=UPI001C206220|nr:sprouty-related, EVH1 domain-containing protein 1 [Aricia agestis]
MTEASENECLVRVRAQVMCRDEATGGWVALGGGGLADVVLGRRARRRTSVACETATSSASHEYYIHGRRISDNVVVLECTLMRDFDYHKVMPTFHHWVTDGRKFGLTFQTAADARAFDKVVRVLTEGKSGCSGLWPSLPYPDGQRPLDREEDEENNIFECLDLPTESRSSSENSSASRGRSQLSQTPILAPIAPRHPLADTMNPPNDADDSDQGCPYVHLQAVHEYTYPGGHSERSSPNKPSLLRRDSDPLKKSPPLPTKKEGAAPIPARLKCRHCHEWYMESANGAGACEYAPDCFKSCIETVTCIKGAQCVMYHCMSDAEGNFNQPCACGPPDTHCSKRWFAITLMSFIMPCLWCYPPLRLTHRLAKHLRLAGGQHAPQ